jgi:hypothetical protein
MGGHIEKFLNARLRNGGLTHGVGSSSHGRTILRTPGYLSAQSEIVMTKNEV